MTGYNGTNGYNQRVIVPVRPLEPIDAEFVSVATPRVAAGYRTINDSHIRAQVREAYGFPYSGLVPLPMLVDDILFYESPRDIARLMLGWKKAARSCFSASVRCDISSRDGQLFETATDKINGSHSMLRNAIDLHYAEIVSSSG